VRAVPARRGRAAPTRPSPAQRRGAAGSGMRRTAAGNRPVRARAGGAGVVVERGDRDPRPAVRGRRAAAGRARPAGGGGPCRVAGADPRDEGDGWVPSV
jgi:hypothetical protein